MFYNGQASPSNKWPSTVQYRTYRSDQRPRLFWLLILAVVTLVLSVAALIIVFAVESAWFSDSYNDTPNAYGLWRLCLFKNRTCDNWFASNGYIEARHNRDRVGINAWQALEIVFLFLTTSTLIVTLIAVVCYRYRRSVHYYLVVLAAFAMWPAAAIGVSSLFVFGFSVYNVSQAPHNLEWCFYVNLVAVILAVISALLLTAYDIFLKRPRKTDRDTDVIDTFADFNGYGGSLTPSSYVVVPRKQRKARKEPYDYPRVLYPQQYLPAGSIGHSANTDFVANPNHRMLAPSFPQRNSVRASNPPMNSYRGPGLLASHSAVSLSMQGQFYPPPTSAYPYQQPHWHRTAVNYNHNEPPNDYIQRGLYRPARLNPIEQRDEPRVLHYYTGYDHFSTVDPSDATFGRHYPPSIRSGSSGRYPVNPPYYQQNAYLKSAL